MPRKKSATAEDAEPAKRGTPRKRPTTDDVLDDDDDVAQQATPSKRRRVSRNSAPEPEDDVMDIDVDPEEEEAAPTPTAKRRGRPPKQVAADEGEEATTSTPKSKGRTPVKTPSRANGVNVTDTPSRRNVADRSARRKSARALIDRVMGDAISDDEEERDETIARQIYESSGDEDESVEEGDVEVDQAEESAVAETPSKTPGRKKRVARQRSPTPPRDLPPHEQYFYQNKPGLTKTSNNNLSSLDLLTHDEYFTILRKLKEPHAEEIRSLQALHAANFPQWAFELSQGFTICLYGYGSKRSLLREFATHLYSKTEDHAQSKIVVVNGYVRTTSTRDILTTIGSAVDPSQKIASGNPMTMLQNLTSLLSSHDTTITLIINSLDSQPLRKHSIQSIIAQLASHPQIRLLCSADTPDFSLLWDSGLRSSFNFVFHNGTTFAPFTAEIDVVDEVHELLGRKARRVGGKEGVTFVLRSLPENAKNLFRLLVTEVLVAMDDGSGASAEGTGVEYRMLYNKAVEEFICSSEMAFRTLLKEYHDHQMITSHKDILGTELLSLPFRKDELEAILEDLMA
ncbi:origin recognition complex subunit 2-domain-containing protein [Coniochaeta sp. 2T2.1]|nr:origin recognition complex subunit 2-domain-containing protein [Coniochaeta sp. 2T2.1]